MENARKDILAQMAMRKLFATVNVTDDEIKEYYEANKGKYSKGASVHAKHILVDNEEKCTELFVTQLQAGRRYLRMLQKNLLHVRQEQTEEILESSEEDRW